MAGVRARDDPAYFKAGSLYSGVVFDGADVKNAKLNSIKLYLHQSRSLFADCIAHIKCVYAIK